MANTAALYVPVLLDSGFRSTEFGQEELVILFDQSYDVYYLRVPSIPGRVQVLVSNKMVLYYTDVAEVCNEILIAIAL